MIDAISAVALADAQKFFDELPDVANKAAMMAINDVARGEGLAIMRDGVNHDINYPAGYLNDKLTVTKLARENDLTAVISGRDRPTSLARFAPGQTPANTFKRGVRVEVKNGSSKYLKNAWLMTLRNGNIGLAIRLKPGEVLHNKREVDAAVSIGKGVYLLYGPSVEQVFQWIAHDHASEVGDLVRDEFYRQFGRLSHG